MAEKPRNLVLSDEVVGWLKARAAERGSTMSAEAEAILRQARSQEAGQAVAATAVPALRDAVGEAVGERFVEMAQALQQALDTLALEAIRARMTGEELLAYQYDSDNLICPHCTKPYRQAQSAAGFAHQRSEVIKQKARDIFASGGVPRLRVQW